MHDIVASYTNPNDIIVYEKKKNELSADDWFVQFDKNHIFVCIMRSPFWGFFP